MIVKTRHLTRRKNEFFKSKVEVPRIRVSNRQNIETLINEESLLFAKFLTNERETWKPRIVRRRNILDNL